MAKSDTTQEQARAVIDRVAQEIGLLVSNTSGFVKILSPSNKHRIYVQLSRTLNRIDTTLPIPTDDPAHKPLSAPNGSVTCHITPDLEQLERALRMMIDPALSTQVPNKPRPFAASKAPAARKPKPLSEPMSETALEPVPEGGSLKDRLAAIRDSSRRAKVRKFVENHGLTEDEAEAVVSGKVTLESFTESVDNAVSAEALEVLYEAGIEVQQ